MVGGIGKNLKREERAGASSREKIPGQGPPNLMQITSLQWRWGRVGLLFYRGRTAAPERSGVKWGQVIQPGRFHPGSTHPRGGREESGLEKRKTLWD